MCFASTEILGPSRKSHAIAKSQGCKYRNCRLRPIYSLLGRDKVGISTKNNMILHPISYQLQRDMSEKPCRYQKMLQKIDLGVFSILLTFSCRMSQNFTYLLKWIGDKLEPKQISHHSFKRHQLTSTWDIGMGYCKIMSPIPKLLVLEILWEIETTKWPNKDWEMSILDFKQYHCNSIHDNCER